MSIFSLVWQTNGRGVMLIMCSLVCARVCIVLMCVRSKKLRLSMKKTSMNIYAVPPWRVRVVDWRRRVAAPFWVMHDEFSHNKHHPHKRKHNHHHSKQTGKSKTIHLHIYVTKKCTQQQYALGLILSEFSPLSSLTIFLLVHVLFCMWVCVCCLFACFRSRGENGVFLFSFGCVCTCEPGGGIWRVWAWAREGACALCATFFILLVLLLCLRLVCNCALVGLM